MSFLTVPTHPKCIVYAEHIHLIRSKVMVIIAITKAAAHKNSNPISTSFLWERSYAPCKIITKNEIQEPFKTITQFLNKLIQPYHIKMAPKFGFVRKKLRFKLRMTIFVWFVNFGVN